MSYQDQLQRMTPDLGEDGGSQELQSTEVAASPTVASAPTRVPAPTARPTAEATKAALEPVRPTPTATPATAQAKRAMPVGYPLIDNSPVIDFSVEGDQGIVMIDRADRHKLSAVVPERARAIAMATIDGLEAKLAALPYKVSWLVYDIENWDQTSKWEQQNPPEATRQARAIADRYGAKLAVVPTLGIARQYGAKMAPYVHVFKCQSKGLQAQSTPQEFEGDGLPAFARPLALTYTVSVEEEAYGLLRIDRTPPFGEGLQERACGAG